LVIDRKRIARRFHGLGLLAGSKSCASTLGNVMGNAKEPEEDRRNDEPMTTAELIGWLEFGCWIIVALAPFLYWVNGPAVSTDQSVVRTAFVTLVLIGGTVIRVAKWLRGGKRRSEQIADDDSNQKNG
jgi:hypothetical protein